ncbi:MAG TPA: fasciclin domain-containing protein [Anditalea sp.]|nr:fasciclin domain-containing protein [Anditalea sp.]
MKLINKNFKNSALAISFLMLGAMASVTAQERTQTQTDSRTQDDTQMVYEELFQDVSDTESHDALDLLKQDENFSIFIKLLESSGLEQSIIAQEEVTIFAPTNQAFQQMRTEEYDKLKNSNNLDDLIRILSAHIVPRKIHAIEFQNNHILESPDGETTEINTPGSTGAGTRAGSIIVGGAEIIRHDVQAKNGLIHIVDRIVRTESNTTVFY